MTKPAKIDMTKMEYVSEDQYTSDDFSPPSCWCVRDATGGYMYFLVRARNKAQDLCNAYYGFVVGGTQKYTVMLDKPAQIR